MRYNKLEPAYMVGNLKTTGLTDVTIKIVELSTLNLVSVVESTCVEIAHIPGWYVFSTENISDDTLTDYSNLFFILESASTSVSDVGKLVIGKIDDSSYAVDISSITAQYGEIMKLLRRLLLEAV